MRIWALAVIVATAAALRPSVRASALRAPQSHRSTQLLAAAGSLLPGWQEVVDESGQPYFWNEATGASQWEAPLAQDPAGFAPTSLLPGWQQVFDENGHQFYFNDATGESQWEAPTQTLPARPGGQAALPDGWVTGIDEASGETFYYNQQTGDSQWAAPTHQGAQGVLCWNLACASGFGLTPRFSGKYTLRDGEEELLGRYDLGEDKPTRSSVSAEQCMVRIGADGTPLLLSVGATYPTGWRSRDGGPWEWLQRDDMRVLADGDQVSLDYNDPEGSVLICNEGRATGDEARETGQAASRSRRTDRFYDRTFSVPDAKDRMHYRLDSKLDQLRRQR